MITSIWYWIHNWNQPVVRVRGCPSSMAETILYLSLLEERSTLSAPKIVFKFIYYYIVSNLVRMWRRNLKPLFRQRTITAPVAPTTPVE